MTLDIFLSGGPMFITKMYHKYNQNNGKEKITILKDLLSPCDTSVYCDSKIIDAISYTSYDTNWDDKYRKKLFTLILRYSSNVIIFILLILVFVFYFKYRKLLKKLK